MKFGHALAISIVCTACITCGWFWGRDYESRYSTYAAACDFGAEAGIIPESVSGCWTASEWESQRAITFPGSNRTGSGDALQLVSRGMETITVSDGSREMTVVSEGPDRGRIISESVTWVDLPCEGVETLTLTGYFYDPNVIRQQAADGTICEVLGHKWEPLSTLCTLEGDITKEVEQKQMCSICEKTRSRHLTDWASEDSLHSLDDPNHPGLARYRANWDLLCRVIDWE